MQLQMKVTATKTNSRVQKTGENKGEAKHSVDIFGFSDDGFPAHFAIYGLSGSAESAAVAAKYPAGTVLRASIAPREPYFVDQAELSVIETKK